MRKQSMCRSAFPSSVNLFLLFTCDLSDVHQKRIRGSFVIDVSRSSNDLFPVVGLSVRLKPNVKVRCGPSKEKRKIKRILPAKHSNSSKCEQHPITRLHFPSFLPSTSVFRLFFSARTSSTFRMHYAFTSRWWHALTCPTFQSQSPRYQVQKHPTGLRPDLMNGHNKSASTLRSFNSPHFSTPVGLLGRLSSHGRSFKF